MVTVDLYPNGDAIPNDWDVTPAGDHFEAINEDKGSPSDEDMVWASNVAGDHGQLEQFDFETITGIEPNSITQVVVWTYGNVVGSNSPEVAISWDGGANFSAYVETNMASRAWYSNTFAGLSYSEGDLADFQVSYRADCGVKLDYNYIYACYVVVTYTEAAAGYTHKFLGVLPANIGKICGVPTANIGKVKGA